MLLFQSNAEYQVKWIPTRANVREGGRDGGVGSHVQWVMRKRDNCNEPGANILNGAGDVELLEATTAHIEIL